MVEMCCPEEVDVIDGAGEQEMSRTGLTMLLYQSLGSDMLTSA